MTRWGHVPSVEVIRATGVPLKARPSDGSVYVGAHPYSHGSKSSACLFVWPETGNWYCSSCKDRGDVVDWLIGAGKIDETVIESRGDAIAYLTTVYGESPYEWQTPVPFPDMVGPPSPIGVLPPRLELFVDEETEALQVPRDLIVSLVLGVASAVATPRARICVKRGWEEPLNAYIVPVLDSGELKTVALNVASKPLEELEREAVEASMAEIAQAEAEHSLLEMQLANLKKAAAKPGADESLRDQVMAQAVKLGEHIVPEPPRLLCEDVTSEALVSLLEASGGVIAMISDEGGIFATMLGRYSEGHLAIEVYLKGYTGTAPLRVDRKGRPPEHIPRPRLTLVVCIQPDVLRGLSKHPELVHRGLLPRIAFVLPKSKVGFRANDPTPASDGAVAGYRAVIRGIAAIAREPEDDPHLLELSDAALALHNKYRAEIERQLRPGGRLYEIREWGNKLGGLVARIAGVLHMAEYSDLKEPWTEPVSVETMSKAVRLGDYFAGHALAAFGLLGTSGSLAIAAALWETIVRRGFSRFSRRGLHQAVYTRYKSEQVTEGLAVLEELNYVRHVAVPEPGTQGGRPKSPLYEVNPRAVEPNDGPSGGFDPFDGFDSRYSSDYSNDDASPQHHEVPGTSVVREQQMDSSTDSYNQNHQNHQNYPPVHYISDVEQARQVVAELMVEPVIGLDIETTGLDPLLGKVRLVQLACPSATYVIDAYHVPTEVLTPVLSGGPVKVAHNAKFDAGFLYEAPGGVMPEPLYDTMLADQVAHGRPYGRSLRDLAEDYLGESLDKEEQVSDWGAEQLTKAQIEYAAIDAAVLLPLKQRLDERADSLGLSEVVDLENRTVPAVVWMERSGVGFDRDRWSALEISARERVEKQIARLDELVEDHLPEPEDLLGANTRRVNWNSAAQVLQLLKDLGLDAEDTRQETLEALQGEHPLVTALLDYREASKKVSTYGRKWTDNVHPVTGRVHADWKQIGASTGRMSCARPNLQNLPRDPGYRACFRPAEGKVMIKADYEQIELRIAAEIAPDARMKRAFIEGEDLHATTATLLRGKEKTGDVTPDERQLAKAVNFGLIYGMGAKALADKARTSFGQEMDESEAAGIRRRYFKAYPGIRNWQQLQGRKAETRTVLGRQRILDGDRYYTTRLNSPIQGTGADGLKLALVKMWESRDDVDAFPVLAIHDEIVVEAPAEKADEVKEWLTTCMVEGMAAFLRDVPVEVETAVKDSWS